jgi:hypothetical protein
LVSCVHVTTLSGQHHTQWTIRLWRYGGIISLADMGVLEKGKILAHALLLFNDNQA